MGPVTLGLLAASLIGSGTKMYKAHKEKQSARKMSDAQEMQDTRNKQDQRRSAMYGMLKSGGLGTSNQPLVDTPEPYDSTVPDVISGVADIGGQVLGQFAGSGGGSGDGGSEIMKGVGQTKAASKYNPDRLSRL